MGCSNVPRTRAGAAATGEPTDPGQLFAGEDLRGGDAEALAARAQAAGFVVRYRVQYATSADGMSGYGECWCVAPGDARVTGAFYGAEGQLFIEFRAQPDPRRSGAAAHGLGMLTAGSPAGP